MDGLPHDHGIIALREDRTVRANFPYPRVLRRGQWHIGAALGWSNARKDAPGAATRGDLAPFLALPLHRTDVAARRLAFVGALTPETGAADLLWAADAWAQRHGNGTIHIVWVGEGILKDVLIGQPVAENLLQVFLSTRSSLPLAEILGRCGIFAAPMRAEGTASLIATAMAAGLPVLASSHQRKVARWISEGRTGWLFESRRADALVQTLESAMATSDAALAQMREQAREHAVMAENAASMVRWPWRRATTVQHERGPPFEGLGGSRGLAR